MAYYLPQRDFIPAQVFNHIQSNQAALPKFSSRSSAGGKDQQPPTTQCTPWAPACATSTQQAPPHNCGFSLSEVSQSCNSVYHNQPYFMSSVGSKKRPLSTPRPPLLHRRRTPRDRMFIWADAQVVNDRAYREWDRHFADTYFYHGRSRL
ncbi:hypothetical protein ElyMa_001959600 [Elysia marginata]|uniref:Uncharacterized protein n=1 Tax=Elysia marginata TaxID=1093978 RepID=A0AAV4EZ21_9GAST|nr:hypothetical protein ElyMa_001959600 [Elysia marginata]